MLGDVIAVRVWRAKSRKRDRASEDITDLQGVEPRAGRCVALGLKDGRNEAEVLLVRDRDHLVHHELNRLPNEGVDQKLDVAARHESDVGVRNT